MPGELVLGERANLAAELLDDLGALVGHAVLEEVLNDVVAVLVCEGSEGERRTRGRGEGDRDGEEWEKRTLNELDGVGEELDDNVGVGRGAAAGQLNGRIGLKRRIRGEE